jgi:hypothetical protein
LYFFPGSEFWILIKKTVGNSSNIIELIGSAGKGITPPPNQLGSHNRQNAERLIDFSVQFIPFLFVIVQESAESELLI